MTEPSIRERIDALSNEIRALTPGTRVPGGVRTTMYLLLKIVELTAIVSDLEQRQ